jgi:pimeloyl-ACP methyl ester carboxylesterase
MRRLILFRGFLVMLTLSCLAVPRLAGAVEAVTISSNPAAAPSNIVIGFVGGFVSHDSPNHGPVQLAQQIRRSVPKDTYVRVFENRRRKQAYQAILHLLDTNHDGILSAAERARARIILFGHSWGASAAVMLARDLRRQGVPVLLTVQVDSVAKIWQNDALIPDNVAAAANFYQPHGLIHGRARIAAADPAKTEILGNYRFDYTKNPVKCEDYSWWNRNFTPGHMQSECDTHLWSQVENIVLQHLASPATTATADSLR